ncbi:MAG: aminoglycoside phosphotransferase family protein [Anaerolineae bacterium]
MSVSTTIDPYAVLVELGIERPTRVEAVTGGSATSMWRVEHDSATYALRVFRPDQTSLCKHEVQVMAVARERGIPVPTVHRQGIWQERQVLLLSWMPGDTIQNVVMRQPWRIFALGVSFGQMQAKLHRATTSNALDDGWMRWHGFNDMALQNRLRALSTNTCLLHLDFHPANVMVKGNEISAVLDWTNAKIGDARADYARTYTILAVEPIPQAPRYIGWLRTIITKSWQRGYHEVAGIPADMDAFYAWAGEVMLLDLAPRIGKDFVEKDFDGMRRWIAKKRQGVAV